MESEIGDETDVAKWAHRLMNRSVAQRTITKPETMCELGNLPFVICSESIETVSLSGKEKFNNSGEGYTTNTLPSRYNKREKPEELELSLHQYFHKTKNNNNNRKEFIPHYVGGSGQPVFPVDDKYARCELLKHKPWSKNNPLPPNAPWKELFEEFRIRDDCPISVKVSYERAKRRYEDRLKGIKEPFQADIEESTPTDNLFDEEVDEVIALSETLGYTEDEMESLEKNGFDVGKDYDWSKRIYEVRKTQMYVLILLYTEKTNTNTLYFSFAMKSFIYRHHVMAVVG